MLKLNQALAPLALAIAFIATPVAQERVSRKGPPEFAEVHASIAAAFKAGRFSMAMKQTRELMGVIAPKLTEAILGALPKAPEGFTIQAPRKQNAQAAGMLAAMSASIGTVVEQRYEGPDGQRVKVTVTADSPLIQMFSMWVANPAILGAGAELIKYGDYNAILKKEGNGWSLHILLGNSLVEARGTQIDDVFLLKMFPQAQVDGLSRILIS